MRPNLDTEFRGYRVVTNSLGLRSSEIGSKQQGEVRILSLGESTTFGDKVEGDQTYSARLEQNLNQADGLHRYRVINAGVCAYSSFQSLKYLETSGLQLEPDIVLFYHEFNDFLPSTIRSGKTSDESSLALTDRQLFESRGHRLQARLLSVSGVYRCLCYSFARTHLEQSPKESSSAGNPQALAARVRIPGASDTLHVPVRVPPEDRRVVLRQLLTLCQDHDIRLVIIHPAYRISRRHQCELTQFCEDQSIPMLEAFDSLHGHGGDIAERFRDEIHPSPKGHELLANDLFKLLTEQQLLLPPKGA